MQKFILSALIVFTISKFAWAEEPAIKDAVPPCDGSADMSKPPCNMDSDSINIPPKFPDDKGVIVPPEIPPQGLPNQKKPQKRDLVAPPQKSESIEMK